MLSAPKHFLSTRCVTFFIRPIQALLVKVREPSDWMQPQRWRLLDLVNSDELVLLQSLLGIPDESARIPPQRTSDRNYKHTRAMELANLTKCRRSSVLFNDEGSPEQYPKDQKRSGKLSGDADFSGKSEDSDDSNASYGIGNETTVAQVSKSKGKSTMSNRTTPMDQLSGTNKVTSKDFHKRGEPARADKEESDDSDFDLEAALTGPEMNDDTLVDAAPDDMTDFKLSCSGNAEKERQEKVDEDIYMGHDVWKNEEIRPRKPKQLKNAMIRLQKSARQN
ncbi:hypothetical protein FGIG_11803 [Fasciola gigantica]|uniref:Uncharacterized protein n=1 Tax=Fasciola gigantica TaxID=46835 RepID=A0A504YP42_FASGI|nr:hypothetical protein FGIG_11803 [Fasciola gigantica]